MTDDQNAPIQRSAACDCYAELVSDIQICIAQIGSIYPTFGRACYDEPVTRLAHKIATMVRSEYGDAFSVQATVGEMQQNTTADYSA